VSRHHEWTGRFAEASGLPADNQPVQALTANKIMFSGRCLLKGWHLVNQNASSQTLQLLDGLDANGTPIGTAVVAANGLWQPAIPDAGIVCEIGVFLVIPAGPINGSVWVTPVTGQAGEFEG